MPLNYGLEFGKSEIKNLIFPCSLLAINFIIRCSCVAGETLTPYLGFRGRQQESGAVPGSGNRALSASPWNSLDFLAGKKRVVWNMSKFTCVLWLVFVFFSCRTFEVQGGLIFKWFLLHFWILLCWSCSLITSFTCSVCSVCHKTPGESERKSF